MAFVYDFCTVRLPSRIQAKENVNDFAPIRPLVFGH